MNPMRRSYRATILLWFGLVLPILPAQALEATWEYAVRVSASVQTSPPQIALNWPQDTLATPSSYTVYRKAPEANSWGAGTTVPGTATGFVDSDVTVGATYEYQIVKAASGYTGYGYIFTGINAPLVEDRGKVVVIVDSTYAAALDSELERLEQDLVGDGWQVLRHDVAGSEKPSNVKALIKSDYDIDPAHVKALFLLGHAPVVHSGNLNVDGHGSRPMPADAFYGDMDGTWSDSDGNGTYDQNTIPSDVELEVGRVDFAGMPGRLSWNGPPTFPGELALLRQYLNKDHNFRHALIIAPRRGLVGDGFGVFRGEAFAASGYRNFAPFFGAGNVVVANTATNAPLNQKWVSLLGVSGYLWAYGCGAGSYTSMSSLGTHAGYNEIWSTDIVNTDAKAVFMMMFGSWLAEWDSEDNIMRAALATPTYGLACSWSGRPHLYYHHMGLGETAGFGIRLSQNNGGLYQNQINRSLRGVHIALLGDPTLRLHPVGAPSALTAAKVPGAVNLSWTPSPDSALGYHVYRARTRFGPFTRLTGSLLNAVSFVDSSADAGPYTYMVRAVKLEDTPSGTYYNASQGVFLTLDGAPLPLGDTTPPTVSLTAPSNNTTVSGSQVTISADASDDVGVAGVQFKLDSADLGSEVLASPYSVNWNTTAAVDGLHTLTAVARDQAGNQTTANAVSVLVSNSTPALLPTVTITSTDATATEGATDTASFTLTRTGSTAGDLAVTLAPGGTATKWDDYRRPVQGDMPDTFTIPAGASSVTIRLMAVDDAVVEGTETATLKIQPGPDYYNVGALNSVTITILDNDGGPPPDDTNAPTVSLIAPANNAAVSGSSVTISANASDNVGVAGVQFKLDGTNLGPEVLSAPYNLNWNTTVAADGSHTLTAVARDQAGNQATANSVSVLVSNSSATNAPPVNGSNTPPAMSVVDYIALQLPKPGDNGLNILSPTLLELRLINTKQPDPARVTQWDFVNSSSQLQAPALSEFALTVDGQPVSLQSVGFKRRPLYAPLAARDLRIDNWLYLQLAAPIADNQTVEVRNPSGALWGANMRFVATMDPLRYSPAIHVNQEGYVPSLPKKAIIGYYLGNLGEMIIPASLGFTLVDANTGEQVYQGLLSARLDLGYDYSPRPYQKVLQADFSIFTRPGKYRLVVPGLGASLPFLIDDGIAMAFARTYALGLYHQRCGTNHAPPFTRFTDGPCHMTPASVPSPQALFTFTWNTISKYTSQLNSDNPPQIAPRLDNEAVQLYPFVNQGPVDVSGGHHDAGDYSKYTINSAALIHYLVFAADAFNGVGQLDNLGIPESGDGKSDLLEEAKWEADFLAKMQDTDGGFYFLVYPRDREYEWDILPDHGDPQVVWPKNTAATAAAVAALAQCGSSPLFKSQFPDAATHYLAKARLGWQFLTNAIAKYGKAGAYQKITHYGDDFTHDDELAWAACEMFLATGDPSFHQKLKEWFDPTDAKTLQWGWWRLYGGYGCATRSYAFAVKTGRRKLNELDPVYLTKCQNEIANGAADQLRRAQNNAYGTSFPSESKRGRDAGWYFSSEQAFDMTVAYQLYPRPDAPTDSRRDYLDAILSNLNYEGGCNPVNVTYVTGLGWKRQREIVHQYAQNDRRVLPPSGLPLGNIQASFAYLDPYKSELGALCFPQDGAASAPYPFYDRWADSFNVTTEFVAVDQARSLASLAFVSTLTSVKTQAWSSAAARILGLPAQVSTNTPVTATLQAPGMDLSGARIVWEARGQEPAYGTNFTFVPTSYGGQWVEAEAQWPDGRRVFAAANLFAENDLPTVTIVSADTTATEGTNDTASFTLARTGSTISNLTVTLTPTGTATKWNDYRRRVEGDMPSAFTIPAGASSATFTIMAVDDTEVEGNETATLTIQSGPDYNVGTPYYVTLTLLDNDLGTPPPAVPAVTVIATDDKASRVGPDPGTFTFTRSGGAEESLTVNFLFAGTAAKWIDYRRAEGIMLESVTIPSGAASTALTIYPVGEPGSTGSKQVVLTIVPNVAYHVGSPSSATVTIADDTLRITSVIPNSDGGTQLSWSSEPGRVYRVAYKNSLSESDWTNLSSDITATDSFTLWIDDTGGAARERYYQVRVVN